MQPGDKITIPYPISFFLTSLPRLKGKETGKYIHSINSGVGDKYHMVEINGHQYPLREGEFTKSEES